MMSKFSQNNPHNLAKKTNNNTNNAKNKTFEKQQKNTQNNNFQKNPQNFNINETKTKDNQLKTPQKMSFTPQKSVNKKSNRQEITSENKQNLPSQNLSGNKGVQRSFLLYSKALEKKKYRHLYLFYEKN